MEFVNFVKFRQQLDVFTVSKGTTSQLQHNLNSVEFQMET